MTPQFKQLKSITDSLLSPEMDYETVREDTVSLKKLFSEAVVFDESETGMQENIMTNAGKAIAPVWAASCIDDTMRTRKFMLGIKEAIEQKLKINQGAAVTVMYAGTGPFASLITPLITIFSPLQMQLILLEIHPVSVQYLKKIIQHFGMEDYIRDLVQADAVTYVIPPDQQPDIIVSETMNNALQKEPQVSVVANLIAQCNRNPFLIPEEIKIDACLMGDKMHETEDVLLLKTLLCLDAETAMRIKNNPAKVPALSSGIIVTMPGSTLNQYNRLVLCTTIRIFGQHCLGIHESGLTFPHILWMTDSFKKYPVRLLFKYIIESEPGFRVTLL